MTDIYNMTFLNTANNTLDIAQGVNTESNGWLFGAMLLAFICIVFIVSIYKYEWDDALIGASFLGAVVAGFMWAAELMEWWIIIYPVLILFFAVIYKLWARS